MIDESFDEQVQNHLQQLEAERSKVVEERTEEQPDGLFAKFQVARTDGRDRPGGDKANARYFVLDYANDPYAVVALESYIDACRGELPGLAADLRCQLADAPVRGEQQ